MVSLDEMIANSVVRGHISRILDAPRGIIAINGDAASGKTMGAFALAEELRKRGRNCTAVMRDPENRNVLLTWSSYPDWDIRMVEDTDQAWASALADVPVGNVILVDELYFRTARPVIQAASRGATVLAVVSTPYIGVDVAYSLQKNGIPTQEFLEHFSCVASQILVPRLCPHCRVQLIIDVDKARQVDPSASAPMSVWREVGCNQCGQRGVKDRLALHEVLMIDQASKPFLANYLDHGDLRNPLPPGHVSVQETARELLRQGAIGLNTYTREVTQNPILRMQHQWEIESRRAGRIREMFSRFVTSQVVDRMLANADLQTIMDGERRRVTCMFADIRGFTTLAESLPANVLFLLLNLYFKEIIQIVTDHGGTIDKFVGDCVMVIFGAPVDQSEHEYVAVRCAIDIQQCVDRLNQKRSPGPALLMGIGINTGDAVTGCLGSEQRMDYTALGDAVNIAARLESHSTGGQIVIGPLTAEAVKGRVPCLSLGFLKLKGKADRVEAFEVVVEG